MRVALVAGPDPGHTFPAVALGLRLIDAGHEAVLFTGSRWSTRVPRDGLPCEELEGLVSAHGVDDLDAGARLHARAARMSTPLAARLRELAPDVVVSDAITACGGLAAERAGVAWVELSPHPLYLASRGLPPLGSGLAPGRGLVGHARDAALRALTARSLRQGVEHRRVARASVGLPAADPGPAARIVATLPALEMPRPDWPACCHVVGPLVWDPATTDLEPPTGAAPLVLVSPSTAYGGVPDLVDAVGAGVGDVRVVATVLAAAATDRPANVLVGVGRQDPLLAQASMVVCGGGHGMLVRALAAGVPVVVVPGGGDQWELAQRARRQGSALVVRPLDSRVLGAAVRRVLTEPSFRASARRAAASLAEVAHDPVDVCVSAAQRSGN